MLIRKPVENVFEAFIDPAITTNFWFTKSSGKLEAGKEVRWEWEMYGVSARVRVKAIEPQRRILIEWNDPPVPVEWLFSDRPDGTTLVSISTWGFHGSDDGVVKQALDSMGGFSFVLAALKALLEHNIGLNLVADHYPDAHKRGS
ncbi:MAG TPA: SRPBCC family protein [Terriglobales bacterium]